ncbi:MAG: bifunctional oligoribonuclease/PAP phosphatase NrnA [Bacilli bacterium]|nr:bifunctional oligoribonuclease/PAP phosphatase NrnA [Bacilli bacterium]
MTIINKDLFRQIFKLIKSYDEIVIARHIGPDPDAIASQIALRESIKLTFPDKRVYAVGAGVSKFKYLGSLDKIDYNSITNALLIVLDVPNFIRVDGIEGLTYKDIVKIDHHPKEDIEGTADFTSSDYSSTAEMVADLIFNTKLMMDKNIAENLFLGIVSDSERFLFKNTQMHTFEVVVKLIKDYSLDFVALYDFIYEKSFNECRFEAYIINNLTITDNRFGYILIDPKAIEEYGVDHSTPSVVINNFNFIKELNAWCFITYDERNEIYKVNIRSRGPVINEVASKYNGGGHKYASGARISKKSEVEKIIADLDKVCEEYLDIEER